MKPERPRIVVSNWVHEDVLGRLGAIGEVDANRTRTPWPREELTKRAALADALLAFMTDHVDVDFLAACPRVKVIACALKGFDNFDVEACTAAGVWVTIVPDLLTNPTAELAVALALGLGRKLREADARRALRHVQGLAAYPLRHRARPVRRRHRRIGRRRLRDRDASLRFRLPHPWGRSERRGAARRHAVRSAGGTSGERLPDFGRSALGRYLPYDQPRCAQAHEARRASHQYRVADRSSTKPRSPTHWNGGRSAATQPTSSKWRTWRARIDRARSSRDCFPNR